MRLGQRIALINLFNGRSGNGLRFQAPWLKSYDSHVSPEITVTDRSLVHRLAGVRRDFPHKPAVHFLGVSLTFDQIMALG